ncbi:IS3 family transposase [Acidithrix ferrooxidans]|uniref:IS3 family transposase n=1 Tax=Acidithrix ferrooxidans TaxID=1280514 RepID=UPI0009E5B5F9
MTQFLRTFVLEHKAQGYKRAYRYVIDKGYHVNIKKVRSLWRQAGLKVPYKNKKKSTVGNPNVWISNGIGIRHSSFPSYDID